MIQPDAYAQRAANLLEAHPWMDHPTALTIAQNTGTDQQAQQQAAQTQQAVQQSWNGYEQAYFDPVLQTQPSNALAVAQYLHSTLGPPPVSAGTNLAVQNALVKAGFLDAAQANGSWTPVSERAYMQAISSYKQDQLAGGHKPLSSKVSSFLGGLFHDVTHPWDAMTGWYDSATEALGYFGGWAATGFGTLGTASTQAHLSGNITRALGHHETDQQAAAAYSGSFGHRLLEAGGNALALGGAASVAKGVGKAAVEQAAKGALESSAKQAAAQSASDETQAEIEHAVKVGQAISAANRMGFVGRSVNDIAQAFRDGTLPADAPQVQRNLGYITKTFLRTPAKLTSAQWAQNLPGLARMAPAAEWLAGKEGAVLKARNLMAYPYRFAPVRAAGIANQRLQIATLGAHALAGALPGTSFQHNIDSSTSLDAWISNLDHWEQRTFGLSVDPTDLLLGPLHGDLVGAGRASRVIGATVDHYTNSLADSLGKLGVPAAFQTATGLTHQELLDAAGGDSLGLQLWMHARAADYAGDAYVERQLGKGVTLPDSGEEDQVTALKNQWHALPAAQQRAFVQEMLKADPHLQWLSNRVANDILRNATSKAAKTSAVQTSLATFLENLRDVQDLHRSGAFQYLMGPRGHKLLAEDLTARAIQGGTADIPGGPGSAQHLAMLNKELPGAFGVARVDTKTADEVQDDLRGFRQQAQRIAGMDNNVEQGRANTALADALRAYMHEHFNMDASKLSAFDSPEQLLAQIDARSKTLASNVLPTYDQPQWVKDRLASMRARGYKLVVGSHIGHVYDGTLPDLGDVWQWKTRLRSWAGKAGLDPQRVPDVEVSRATNASIAGRVHHFLTTDPQAAASLAATPYADYRTALAVLQHGVAPELPAWARGVFNFFAKRGMNRTEIQHLADTEFEGNLAKARAEMEQRMAAQIGLRDLPDDVARKALMTPANIDANGKTFQWGGVDEHTANGILRAVKEGYRLPGYIMGWQAIENWARAPFGFAGGTMGKVMRPAQPLYNRVGNWTNDLVQLRNTLRFTASPLFDARRLAKQNYKMSLELGRPVTVWNPLQDLTDNGELDQATKLWSKISGAKPDTQMDADRYLLARSIFGLYSPQWHAAWFVNEMRKTGKAPDEIKQAYDRVFKYGAQGGRTSAERSVNTIFFPFSFEKNLLRNTGAYLADRPGQALALDLAVENWRQIDSNGQVGQWVQAHAPILAELNKLNGFAHGISPGQFGGINAGSLPALNLFLPQHWGSEFTAKNLAKYLPVWKDFAQLVTATHEQLDIVNNAAYDTINKLSGGHNLNRPTLTPQAQITDALNTKAKWVTALQPVLDYNAARASDADKISWPDQAQYGVLQGKPVDKTTIGEYMQMLYPAYNPDAGAAVAQNNARAADAFIAKVKARDPQKAAQLAAFKQAADKVIGHINRDDYTPQVQAAAQTQFQQYAEHAAQQDPDWLKFYSKFYAFALGQIISPTGKAASA